MRAYRCLLVPIVLLAACGGSSTSSDTAAKSGPPAAPAPAAEASNAHEIDVAETNAMLEILRTDTSADKRIFLVVSPRPETVKLGATLEAVFRQGGWQPTTKRLTGMVIKPGPVRILVAEEQEPPQVDSARRALEAGGLTVETGTGYRAFYEEKKRENPSWPGILMMPEQPFIVVIAPPAPAT